MQGGAGVGDRISYGCSYYVNFGRGTIRWELSNTLEGVTYKGHGDLVSIARKELYGAHAPLVINATILSTRDDTTLTRILPSEDTRFALPLPINADTAKVVFVGSSTSHTFFTHPLVQGKTLWISRTAGKSAESDRASILFYLGQEPWENRARREWGG